MRAGLLALLLVAACRHKEPPAPAAPPVATAPADRYAAAKRALEAGRLDEAEAHFRAVADSTPTGADDPALRANALLGLASLRKERGDGKGAVVLAQQVVALRPEDDDALRVLVDLAHEAGALAVEIEAREAIVRLHPDALDERLALAGALTVSKETERAKAAFLAYEEARTRIILALGRSPDAATRRAAARALGAAHDAGTARALVLAMTDRDAGVRADAVRSVGEIGLDLDAELRPALKKLGGIEHDPEVLAALGEVLGQAPAPSAKKP